MAVSTYQVGMVSGWEGLVNQADPDDLLNGMAAVDQLSASRAESLNAFDEATKSLRNSRDGAKKALAEADETRDELSGEKSKADKMVKAQTKILRELNAFQVGNPNGSGVQYTGSASGNARAALAFAFAQIGSCTGTEAPARAAGTAPVSSRPPGTAAGSTFPVRPGSSGAGARAARSP